MGRTLPELYAACPLFQCKPGCHDCCGAVPHLAIEREAMNRPVGFVSGSATCSLAGANGCAVYDNRPLLCRLFGTVMGDNPLRPGKAHEMVCPHGCHPETPLTPAEADQIMHEYSDIDVVKLRSRQALMIETYLAACALKAGKELPVAPETDD